VVAVAIAFGLAFGLGGQETARKWLARGESSVSDAASKLQAQQQQVQATQAQPDRMRQPS
ncbi:MAG TPA: hypothetical protein VIY29_17700, partial [Ktedonobacteraceae bacterium]